MILQSLVITIGILALLGIVLYLLYSWMQDFGLTVLMAFAIFGGTAILWIIIYNIISGGIS